MFQMGKLNTLLNRLKIKFMSSFPKRLDAIHEGQLFLRSKAVKAITDDKDLLRHVSLIERAMDILNMCSTECSSSFEVDDEKVVRLLGMRLFNGCASSMQLTLSGHYQNAAMIMRDLLETVFLLGYFQQLPEKISVWRTADTDMRLKEFAPAKIRIALDEKDGFTEKKRKEAYDLLCELAVHPTYKGFQMLAPKGHDHHCGPFFDPAALKALIEELAKLAIQAAQNQGIFFKSNTKDQYEMKLDFMEMSSDWMEAYLGRPKNQKEIDEIREVLKRAVQENLIT